MSAQPFLRLHWPHPGLEKLPDIRKAECARHYPERILRVRFGGYQCCQQDMPQPVDAEFVEVILCEIEPKAAFEIP
jgi:hypothetical protein